MSRLQFEVIVYRLFVCEKLNVKIGRTCPGISDHRFKDQRDCEKFVEQASA